MHNLPAPALLKSGKYRCNVMNCGGADGCVHDYIPRRCPFCGFQLVKVATNGHIFCSCHESICEYEEHNNDKSILSRGDHRLSFNV